MTSRRNIIIAAALAVVLLGGAAVYAGVSFAGYQARQAAGSAVTTEAPDAASSGSRIVFRNTADGAGYGMVASVPLNKPGGARQLTSVPCDRVYATAVESMCLRIDRGVLTTFSATLYSKTGKALETWPLPGIPSRTRISADSKLVAFTAFVTGASYGTVGFSTATEISTSAGHDYGNLENFTLVIDGQKNVAADRNFWGVTFASDDNTFYATAATGGATYLVRGNLAERTLTAIRQTAECPSLSPDGKNVAYKKNVSTFTTPLWRIAVLNLATGKERILPEKRSVDDQVEWLDASTLLYGMNRANAPGDSDVWSIAASGSSAPHLLIAHAWSPAVVRQ